MAKARRILVAHQGAELYGSDRMVLQLLNALHRPHQTHVTLHVPHDGPLLAQARHCVTDIDVAPLSVLRLCSLKTLAWLKIGPFFRNLRAAWRLLQHHDMVIVNSCVVLTYLVLLPFYRRPKFIYVHEINRGILKYGFNILLCLSGAQLICNSRATAANYPWVPAFRKHVVPNVVAPGAIPAIKAPAPPLHVLMIGRLSRRKGHHVLLEALRLLPADSRKAVELRIVGDSFRGQTDYTDTLHDNIAAHHMQETVTFHPFTADPSAYYQWAHCVVVPSVQPESFGLVALEAMHQGCAVIASNSGALPEIVRDGVTGRIIQADDARALADVLDDYIRNPHRMAEHGLQGRLVAARDYTIAYYRDQIERILA